MNYPYIPPNGSSKWPIFRSPATATTPAIDYVPIDRFIQRPPAPAPVPAAPPAAAAPLLQPIPVQIYPYYEHLRSHNPPDSPSSSNGGVPAHARHCLCDECRDYRRLLDEYRQDSLDKKKRLEAEEARIRRELEEQQRKNEIDRYLLVREREEERRLAASLAAAANANAGRHHHHHHSSGRAGYPDHHRTGSSESLQAIRADVEKLRQEQEARRRHERELATAKKYKEHEEEKLKKAEEEHRKQLKEKEKLLEEKERQMHLAKVGFDYTIDKLLRNFEKERKEKEEKDKKEKDKDHKKKGKGKQKEETNDDDDDECLACELVKRLADAEYHGGHYHHHHYHN